VVLLRGGAQEAEDRLEESVKIGNEMISWEIVKTISWEIFDPWLPFVVSTLFTVLLSCYTFRYMMGRSVASTTSASSGGLGQREALLAESMVAGGPGRVGLLGRVTGPVQVEVRGNSNGAVGVCFCGQLNVIYWWRAVAVNGHSILVSDSVGSAEVSARAAAATMRLWGSLWEGADEVEVRVEGVHSDLARTRLEEQAEDCQNKYGVRVRLQFEEPGAGGADDDGEEVGGARELAEQLIAGDGAGQQAQGFHNSNLRIVDNVVFQLVDHTSKLSKHYFDL